MYLECLANELLLDLFEYFNGIDLFRAFDGLNDRFNRLLLIHFHAYHFDFRSISKHDFDYICHHYLPSILHQIISLKFSDDDETPNLPEYFLSRDFTIDKFIRLQSLSFYSLQSFNQLNQLLFQSRQLPHLTHLNLIEEYNDHGKNNIQFLINNIWSLPSLHHLSINYNLSGQTCLTNLSIPSLTIQYLSIENTSCTLQDLLHLFRYTPNLRYLNTKISFRYEDEQISGILPFSLISLKLTFESSVPVLIKLFQMTPNLQSLTIKTMDIYLTGNKWKKILENSLSKLQIFRLRMYFEFPQHRNIDEEFDKLLRSYRRSFWIEKHRWFIQCDCIPFGTYYHGILYTLPYAFDTFICYDTMKSKYTCPNEKIYWSCPRVNSLQYMNYRMNSCGLPIQFPNIRHLKIAFPFDDQFYSLIPSLHRLTSLEVILGENYTEDQLQRLIHTSSCLYSLRFFYSIDLKISIGQITSSTIRRLNFKSKCSSNITYFNHDECAALAYSQLGQQCEVLLIQIEHRDNVLDLIETMKHLRALVVQCKDASIKQDELIEWLRIRLPTTYSITRDRNEISYIRIWIHRSV